VSEESRAQENKTTDRKGIEELKNKLSRKELEELQAKPGLPSQRKNDPEQ
jgi:hypothetical protein